MDAVQQLARQITDEVAARTIGPLARLLGPQAPIDDLHNTLVNEAQGWAAALHSDDEQLAAHTAAEVAGALFPAEAPVPDQWWRTRLGQAVLRSVGHPHREVVPHWMAAAMLGISRGRVTQLVDSGALETHPDGGVTAASVRTRARQPVHRWVVAGPGDDQPGHSHSA